MASPLSRATIDLLDEAAGALGKKRLNALLESKGYRTLDEIPNDSVAAEIIGYLRDEIDRRRKEASKRDVA